jgi:hypothetical protein
MATSRNFKPRTYKNWRKRLTKIAVGLFMKILCIYATFHAAFCNNKGCATPVDNGDVDVAPR